MTLTDHTCPRQLRRLDLRIEAAVDALAVAGAAAWPMCQAELEASESPGEVFAAAVVALRDQASPQLAALFSVAFKADCLGKALVSALGWYPFAHVEGLLQTWARSQSAFEKYLGVAGYAVHRRPPALELGTLFRHDSQRLGARAVQAVGELGLVAANAALLKLLSDDVHAAEAALALARLGCCDDAVKAHLHGLLDSRPVEAARALIYADTRSAPRYIEAWSTSHPAAAIAGIAALGDVSYVPRLIEWMRDESLAPCAGEAFQTITGFDLAYHELEAEEPAVMTEARALSVPDPAKVQAFWQLRASELERGVHYLCGRVVGDVDRHAAAQPGAILELLHIARGARIRERGLAALRLAYLRPQVASLETRAFAGSTHTFPGLSSWSNFLPSDFREGA